MTTLIERVAKAAGWQRPTEQYWTAENDGVIEIAAYAKGTPFSFAALEPFGLVLLLRELLDAGWDISKDGTAWIMGSPSDPNPPHVIAVTLEEAVMDAYLAHKGER